MVRRDIMGGPFPVPICNTQLRRRKRVPSPPTDQAAALAALHSVSADYGVGLTPHQAVIQRAIAAAETVNQRMANLQKTRGMRDMNDEFKQARKVGTVVRYQDFLHAKKMAMLEELPGDADAAAAAASLRQVANGHRWRYLPAMDWIGWIRGLISAALQWFEAHPGTASWLEAVGSITAIVFVYLFALFQGRRTRSHESTDRIRRAQGLALVLIPALTAFRPKIEMAIIQESKPAPPDEIVHLLDQLYVLGLAGGLILQMVAVLQANQRAELPPNENENVRSSYNSIARQRLGDALRYCDDAIYALMKLTRVRTA